MSRQIPEVRSEHLPGLRVAKELARKYEDKQLLSFLIKVAERNSKGQGNV